MKEEVFEVNIRRIRLSSITRCRWKETDNRGGCMIIAASAYFPPNTCQGVRWCLQTHLIQEARNRPPSECFVEDIGQLVGGWDPFKLYLLLIEQLVDDMEFSIHMAMLLAGGTIGANGNSRLVVTANQRGLDQQEF